MKLSKFVQYWNSGAALEEISDEYAEWVADAVYESFKKQFSPRVHRDLGLSQLGKPAVLNALSVLGLDVPESPRVPLKMQWIFNLGDYFETCAFALLAHYGYHVTDLQQEVKFCGVKGHIDGLVDGRLVEIKTMSGYYWQSFIKEQDDDRGYVTQLHLYAYCKGTKDASWLCLNKWTNELIEIQLDYDPYFIKRAKYIIEALGNVKRFEDIPEYFGIPEPVLNKKQLLVVPESMRWSGVNHLFYKMKKDIVIGTMW